MEFGRVSEKELGSIDFSLPNDPAFNKSVLPGKRAADPKVYVGCAKWGRKEWIGKLYPEGTPEKDFLKLYTQNFNTIELNATSYKMPTPAVVKNWAEVAGNKEFLYCPKLVRYILPSPDAERQAHFMSEWKKCMKEFGMHLGPMFLMLAENFLPRRIELLKNFLHDFPKDYQLFVEVRHVEWYSDNNVFSELIKELSINNTGFIITDTAGRRDMAHMYLTTPKTFIRFVGNSLHESDYPRCDDWVKRIKVWIDKGLEEVYFFMHMHDEAKSPELIKYFIEKLNSACKLNVQVPAIMASNPKKKKSTTK